MVVGISLPDSWTATACGLTVTKEGRAALALLKIEDYYHIAGQQEASLLEVMDAIPGGSSGGSGIEFEPPRQIDGSAPRHKQEKK